MGYNQNSTFGFGSDGDISGGTVTTANNGLSMVGTTTVVLGQDVAEAGDPAELTSNREIPMGRVLGDSFTFTFIETEFRNESVSIAVTPQATVTITSNDQTNGMLRFADLVETIEITHTSGSVVMRNPNVDSSIQFRFDPSNSDISLTNTKLSINTLNGGTAQLVIGPGAADENTAPLKFDGGVFNTTPETGAMEYNGTNLTFVRTGTTRQSILMANVITVESIASNRTVTVNIAGTTIKLLAAV